jgi:hypothetical protein
LHAKLVKIGAWIVRHGRSVVFQLAEVAAPPMLFATIWRRIDRLRGPPAVAASRGRAMRQAELRGEPWIEID